MKQRIDAVIDRAAAVPVPGLQRLARPARAVALVVTVGIVLLTLLGFVWNFEPGLFDIDEAVQARLPAQAEPVVGSASTTALVETIDTLLNKRGGFLANDVLPPGAMLDNMPHWEWGVLRQCRDFAIVLRNDFSRSQTQSTEDEDLVIAETKLHIDSAAWMFPSAEAEYRDAKQALERYLARLSSPEQTEAQFFARADNLRVWLGLVEKRLGDMSQRLSASVGQARINTDLEGDAAAAQSTATAPVRLVKTGFFEIDDVFFETRGSAWALIHFLKAAERDFGPVLEKKNALVSIRQIIRELEATQEGIWSPFILNGTGFGLLANHSLVMASYISRANAAVIDLEDLLERG